MVGHAPVGHVPAELAPVFGPAGIACPACKHRIVRRVFSDTSLLSCEWCLLTAKTEASLVAKGTLGRDAIRSEGIRCGTRFTPEEVRRIRKSGDTDSVLARKMGVEPLRIWKVRRGRSYKNVV